MKDFFNWHTFLENLNSDVMPIYREKEVKFDLAGIHGQVHIARALVFAEFMIRFYHHNQMADWSEETINAIRYAVAFHDSGREGNGPDFWEHQSAEICFSYLVKKGFKKAIAKNTSKFIVHGGTGASKHILSDADVLEIMRPICGHGGFEGFNTEKLIFLSQKDPLNKEANFTYPLIRIRLIQEAWTLIEKSEWKRFSINPTHDAISFVFDFIASDKSFGLLREVFIE